MSFIYLIIVLLSVRAHAEPYEQGSTSLADIHKIVNETLATKWYERLQLRGYAQIRYNRLMETNPDFNSSSTDRSIGSNKGFFLRRARLILFGEVTDRAYIYIQPDYAQDSTAGSTPQNYLQIRDAYFDYALSQDKEWRVRTGISKVPYGFSNLQSSSNRAPLDRDDALNTGAPNERDTGVFLMYAPTEVRKRFKDLANNTLKGSGDYGMLAIGAYNGQTLNKPEENNDLHRVVRVTYPFKFASGQFIEASLQAYEGKYKLSTGQNFYDQRSALSFIYFPQPFGLQVEYNVGTGPEYDKNMRAVTQKRLNGGYAQINYAHNYKNHRFYPYLRFQDYDGGRKLDNGNHFVTTEWELGSEWQPNSALELTVAYAISDRLVESGTSTQNIDERGQLLRLQAQFNY
ncbi:MAG: porin [Bacteriovoracaceae bacterium]